MSKSNKKTCWHCLNKLLNRNIRHNKCIIKDILSLRIGWVRGFWAGRAALFRQSLPISLRGRKAEWGTEWGTLVPKQLDTLWCIRWTVSPCQDNQDLYTRRIISFLVIGTSAVNRLAVFDELPEIKQYLSCFRTNVPLFDS